jgi:hypothetical protein
VILKNFKAVSSCRRVCLIIRYCGIAILTSGCADDEELESMHVLCLKKSILYLAHTFPKVFIAF